MKQIQRYNALWKETNTLYAEWAKRRHLSYSELLVVLSLAEMEGSCLQKDICKQWTLPKQTVNTVLKSFMERSFVRMVSNEEDRRAKTIELTAEGKRFCQGIARQLQKLECSVWDKLGEEHASVLLEAMTRYNQFFQEGLTDENP